MSGRPARELLAEVGARLRPVLAMLAEDPASLSSVTDPEEATRVHLADSLAGLAAPELTGAGSVGDIGSGAGFPGLPLAAAMPGSRFDLIESVGRKADFIERAIEASGLDNARAVRARSETWASGPGRGRYRAVTARAVADLVVLAELAVPLLAEGGSLIAWKGRREIERERALRSVSGKLAMSLARIEPVRPFEGSRQRHLYVVTKTGPTPEGLPRRPGIARKRPAA